jgi:phospholipid-binding lipoprotein MlaA
MRRLALIAALALAATPAHATGDPLESVNRAVHGFNQLAQRHVLGPVAEAYLAWTPLPVREGVSNAVANLAEPVTAANALLAGDTGTATTAALRFGINSTLGVAGLRDPATDMGYLRQTMALGDTLCRWGIPSGPYLVLPLLGPSSLRDAGGMAVTTLALAQAVGSDAVLAWQTGTTLVDYASAHPAVQSIESTALDSYATWRSLWRQRRAATCAGDMPGEDEP